MAQIQSKKLLDKFLDILWPIKRHELKLFIPMSLIMLCILFNFGTLRSVKDGLIVSSIGPEAISFLKFWFVLPSSIIVAIIYAKLSNVFSSTNVFYIMLSMFLCIFALFAYVIYPNELMYHPDPLYIQKLIIIYPNFKWFLKIWGKWSYAIFYIASELWSVVVINLMFWQFANNIFDTESAKRFYPILGVIGNLGLVVAGNMLVHFASIDYLDILNLNLGEIDRYKSNVVEMLQPIVTAVIASGISAMFLFKFINSFILKDVIVSNNNSHNLRTKLPIKDSIKLISKSRYLWHILLLILCYGLLINLLEGPWKSKLNLLYPDPVKYINFMGQFNIWMGITSVTFMFIGSNILRSTNWLVGALFTPIMLLLTGIVFFGFVLVKDMINTDLYQFNPIYIAVIAGAVQNILSKSTKYSLFDATKEMAYIPLSLELKTKGKAVVEIVGLKFGKAGGAFIQSFIFLMFPFATFDSIIIYLLTVFIVVLIVWFWNVVALNREYNKLVAA